VDLSLGGGVARSGGLGTASCTAAELLVSAGLQDSFRIPGFVMEVVVRLSAVLLLLLVVLVVVVGVVGAVTASSLPYHS
jgi:hypothetical protein